MKEKYKDYIISFNHLDIYDKRKELTNELLDLLKIFYKINKDFNIDCHVLPIINDSSTEEEYLTSLCSCVLSLKEVSSDTIKFILDNFYEKNEL